MVNPTRFPDRIFTRINTFYLVLYIYGYVHIFTIKNRVAIFEICPRLQDSWWIGIYSVN